MLLKLISFNIRYSGAKDGINCWSNRKSLVIEIIKQYHPDIIGFQEMLQDQYEDLVHALPEYRSYHVGRDDGLQKGEACAIFYRDMELLSSGTFWLSDTPSIPGSRWDTLPRICSWVHLSKDKRLFALYNCHLDNRKEKNRNRSIPIIFSHIINESRGLPCILMGDFNSPPRSSTYKLVVSKFKDCFTEYREKSQNHIITYHENFSGHTIKKSPFSKDEWIDYIFISKEWHILSTEIIYASKIDSTGIFASDHWPISITLSHEIKP